MIFWSTGSSPTNTNNSETRRAASSNACSIFSDTMQLCRRKKTDERSECKPDRAQPSSDERSECKPDRAQPQGRAQPSRIVALAAVSPGKHVGRRGEDVTQGTTLFSPGRLLRPQDIGVLSSVDRKDAG